MRNLISFVFMWVILPSFSTGVAHGQAFTSVEQVGERYYRSHQFGPRVRDEGLQQLAQDLKQEVLSTSIITPPKDFTIEIARMEERCDPRTDQECPQNRRKPIINAFAVPGTEQDHIVFSQGLVECTSRTALVGIASHEIAHLYYGHSASGVKRATVWGYIAAGAAIGTNGGRGWSEKNRRNGQLDWQYAGPLIAANGVAFEEMMRFIRGHESESDDSAVKVLKALNLNPAEVATFFDGLPNGHMPGFLSSHPSPKSRAKKFRQAAGITEVAAAAPEIHGKKEKKEKPPKENREVRQARMELSAIR